MLTSKSYPPEIDGGGKHMVIWVIQVREENSKFSLYHSYLVCLLTSAVTMQNLTSDGVKRQHFVHVWGYMEGWANIRSIIKIGKECSEHYQVLTLAKQLMSSNISQMNKQKTVTQTILELKKKY